MLPRQTPRAGARRRRPLTALTASLATILLASACAGGETKDDASSAPHPETTTAVASEGQAASPGAASADGADASAEPVQRKAEGQGQGDPEALKGVHVTVGEDGAPTVTLDGPVTADAPATRVLTAGPGELPKNGDTVKVSTVVIDPSSGEVLGENFTSSPQPAPLSDQVRSMYPEMYELLTTNGVGSVVAAYSPRQQVPVPPTAAPGDGASPSPSPSSSTVPAQLFAYRIDGIMPTAASGAEVKDLDPRLPAVTVDDAGRPQIAKPSGEAPAEMVVQPLLQGDGPVVGEDDTVTVQYTGATWSEGSVFDSSWERGEPATFGLNGVITGWKEGLAGQRVGSRVLLSIPADKAYGEQGSPPKIGPNEPLLFVVDILDAQAAPSGADASAAPQN